MHKVENELYLNKKLYDKLSIRKAIMDYVSISDISLSERGDYYICTFQNWKADLSLVMHEFTNYAIGLGVKTKRCFKL